MFRLMNAFWAVLCIFAFCSIALADQRSGEQKPYVNDYLASEAVRLAAKWKSEIKPSKDPVAKQKAAAIEASKRGDYASARDAFISAIVADPKDWNLWNQLAVVLTYLKSDNAAENFAFQQNAEVAAYQGYQLTADKADEAFALNALALVYQTYKQNQVALNILRVGLKGLDGNDTRDQFVQVRESYATLRADYGFRLTDYKLDSDAANARACFTFSEDLALKVDFTPYVTVSGVPTAAITAEQRQLCVEGLEHGKSYHVVIRQGLPSAVGEDLLKASDYDLYVKDRAPAVRFTGRNYVLPRTGQEGLPIVTVNTDKVAVQLYRVGDRNLLPTVHSDDFLHELQQYQADNIGKDKGVQVWSGTLDVKSDLNKDIVTAFPVLQAVGKLDSGIYIMVASPQNGKPDDYDLRATQWFLVSDLGLTSFTGINDGLHVFVRSLSSAEPAVNVKVRLIAKNNEVLDTRTTDFTGHVVFDAGLTRGKGGSAPGMIVAENVNGDYGFLDQQQTAFDLTDRGVKGRESPAGVDAFLYAERGVYRSGETVNVTALLRDAKGHSVPRLPLTLVAERSDGVEYKRDVVADQGEGGRSWSLPLISGVPTGTWHVHAFTDPKQPAVGDVTFLVEDYVPERIDMKLTAKQKALNPGEPLSLDLVANYLYGAPADGLAVTGDEKVELAAETTIPGLADWTVGLDDEPFEAIAKDIEGEHTTDEKGAASLAVEIPQAETSRPLQATVNLRLTEAGGRAIERTVTVPILPKDAVLAVQRQFDDGALSAGDAAKFKVVYAAPNGTWLAKTGVKWQLSRIDRSYQWYNSEGRWDFEVVKSVTKVSDGIVDLSAVAPIELSTPVDWGMYRLDVSTDDASHPHTSVTFSVGWGGSDKADTPDVLDVATDRSEYVSSEEMNIRLSPRFAGKALVAVVSDRIETTKLVDVQTTGTTVTIQADKAWGAGAYVVAIAYRPLDLAAHRMPGRAIGVTWVAIDRTERTLAVKLDVPAVVRPNTTLATRVVLGGFIPGATAHVTVSAVDVGILNLTHYATPNPETYVFGQHLLSGELRDLYGYLIDGMQGTRGAITSGGDADAKKIQGPPDQEPLSRYSGVVTVAEDGTAVVNFDLPNFNGTVRVSAVAWTKDRLGHADADVIVRDPVVVQATLPRFLTLGDQTQLQLSINNVEGRAADYSVDIAPHGSISLQAANSHSVVKLGLKAHAQLALPLSATGVGTGIIDVKVSGPDLEVSQSLNVPVQPATSAVYHRSIQALAANGGSIKLSDDLTKDFINGTGIVSISVTPNSAFDVASLLKALDRYPYGCTEQTVSIAMPLLYLNKLALNTALDLDGGVDERIKKAIATVLARQDSNGSFGLWGVGGDDIWLDSFVADFLTRARERGFAVPQPAMISVLDRLRNFIVNTTEPKEADAYKISYAAYVLARNGRPIIGDLRYLADTKPDIFVTPLARAQVGAALALLGDRGRAQPLFQAAFERLQTAGLARVWRADYGTPLRDGAGMIALMAESGAEPALLQKVEAFVGTNRETVKYTSTQENSWMVMAAFATAKEADEQQVTIDGLQHAGALYQTFTSQALKGTSVSIVNVGPSPLKAVLNASGHPTQPEPAVSQGFTVERTFHKLDGTVIDAKQVRQTDRLVVVLKVTEAKADNGMLMLVDRLPAGFEIENPDLVKSADLSGFDWLDGSIEPKHTEFRDDRFVATFDRAPNQSAFIYAAYMIRAVAPGKYNLPPATIEDMYRPERFGRSAYGSIEVTPAKAP